MRVCVYRRRRRRDIVAEENALAYILNCTLWDIYALLALSRGTIDFPARIYTLNCEQIYIVNKIMIYYLFVFSKVYIFLSSFFFL